MVPRSSGIESVWAARLVPFPAKIRGFGENGSMDAPISKFKERT